jgi:hypothetical protein
MRLGYMTNGISCEYEMQDAFKLWLEQKELKYVDELLIKDVGRIADFLALKPSKGIINIEAKCNDFDCMMKQLNDHATYCDYSFAFIPDYPLTPKHFKEELARLGYGLIVWNSKAKVITEVLEAHHNKPPNKKLKKKITEIVREANEA